MEKLLNTCSSFTTMTVDFIDEMKKEAFVRLNGKSMTDLRKEVVIEELAIKYPTVSKIKITQIVAAIDRERYMKQTMGGISPTPVLMKEIEADKKAEKLSKKEPEVKKEEVFLKED